MDKARWRWVKCFVCFLRFHSFWLGDPPVHSEQNWFLNLQVKYHLSAKMEIFGLGSANKKFLNFLSHILISCIDKLILTYCLWKWWLGPQYFVLTKNTFLNRFSSQCDDAFWSRTTDTYDLCSHMMLGQVCPRMECLECHWIKIIPRTTKQTDWRLVSDGFWESTRKMSFIWAIGFCKKWATFISIF